MEIIDNTDTDSDSDFTNLMRTHLITTAKWGNVLSIISFVGIGLVILIALSVWVDFSEQDEHTAGDIEVLSFFLAYFVFAALGLIPAIHLSKFSNSILKNVSSFSRSGIEQAFSNLKASFKYIGLLIIIIIVFHVLMVCALTFGDLRAYY